MITFAVISIAGLYLLGCHQAALLVIQENSVSWCTRNPDLALFHVVLWPVWMAVSVFLFLRAFLEMHK